MKKFNRLMSLAILFFTAPLLQAQDNVGMARYNEANQLNFPAQTDQWIHLGSSVGGEYGDEPFDPQNPGTLGVVQMEPAAYRYLRDHGHYADGTMFLLTFYASEGKSSPQLPGFVQGAIQAKEIHVIDRQRFGEGRAFYLFDAHAPAGTLSTRMPDNSNCIQCHMTEGAYDGTFTQFYTTIRDLVSK